MMMKKIWILMAVGLTLSLGLVHAAGTSPQSARHQSMVSCNKDAADKKGDERKAFMKECLTSKPAVAPAPQRRTPQEKMKFCNKEAAGQKGEPRKAFMKECLSK